MKDWEIWGSCHVCHLVELGQTPKVSNQGKIFRYGLREFAGLVQTNFESKSPIIMHSIKDRIGPNWPDWNPTGDFWKGNPKPKEMTCSMTSIYLSISVAHIFGDLQTLKPSSLLFHPLLKRQKPGRVHRERDATPEIILFFPRRPPPTAFTYLSLSLSSGSPPLSLLLPHHHHRPSSDRLLPSFL